MTSDFVAFEVSDVAASARLAELLSDRWNVVLSAERSDVMVVVVELRSGPGDVAGLLRGVEAWVEDESACAIRYELDGRGYVLEAGGLQWSLDAAAAVADEVERLQLERGEGGVSATEADPDQQKPVFVFRQQPPGEEGRREAQDERPRHVNKERPKREPADLRLCPSCARSAATSRVPSTA